MKFQGRTTAAIIRFPENKIILVKRTTPPFIGYWALPGGRVERGESVEEAILREIKEETGLEVRIVRKIGEYHEKGIQDGYEYNYQPACFLVEPKGGEIKRQESEISDIELFDPDQVPKALAFEHSQMIKDFVAQEMKGNSAIS